MPLVLLILFIAMPIAEIYVIIRVGDWIGWLPTIALLILDGFVGAALARSQGRAAWARFNRALTEGRVPASETFDGAMIVLGGALLLAPGFITDVFGFALLFPPTRALMRAVIARLARRRMTLSWTVVGGPAGAGGGAGRRPGPPPGYGPRARRRAPGRGYDYEGTAREVADDPGALPAGEREPGGREAGGPDTGGPERGGREAGEPEAGGRDPADRDGRSR
ncbi:MAG: hypothetical protein GEU88_04740 [Solirubrobacterales bacterium]|nr:hypothetical protein [Solirubrobacterales bacterium]